MGDALIGVVMPVFNCERYVSKALNSLLRESDLRLQVVVVDDGSVDGTRDRVRAVAQRHGCVRLLECEHGGVSKARNAGLRAFGDEVSLVTFLDGDDLNAGGRIQRQLELLNAHPEVEWVIGQLQIFEDEDDENLRPRAGSRTVTIRGVSLSAALFRRGIFDSIGFLAEDMRYAEDCDFYLRLLEAETPYWLDDEVAVFYRRHGSNATNDVARTRLGFMDALRRSLARRRVSGASMQLGDLFRARADAERSFHRG